MKHYTLGFVFNRNLDKVLLVQKKRPKWQAGHWNGIGRKIDGNDPNPLHTMSREAKEETGHYGLGFTHCITFVCPGGTVYVFKGNSGVENIPYKQKEDEKLKVFDIDDLPFNMMDNLKWMIPVCLSSILFPIMVHLKDLGVEEYKESKT